MRPCTKCGKDFEPTAGQAKKHWWYCADCRRAAHADQRRRGVAGKPGKYLPDYHQRPRVKLARKLRARSYSQARWRDPEERRKKLARRAVEGAVARGTILKTPCVKCGCPQTQAHHSDYSKRFDVIWLCASCHRAVHRANSAVHFSV